MDDRMISFPIKEYDDLLRAKKLPSYSISNRNIVAPREYVKAVFDNKVKLFSKNEKPLSAFLFDYEKYIVRASLRKRKFAIFADCGLGKTVMFLEYIKHVENIIPKEKKILIISPLMVIDQTLAEEEKFYNERTIRNLHKENVLDWVLNGKERIGITNYEKFHSVLDFEGNVGCVVLDESSILKSSTGVTKRSIIESFKGVEYKLACSATPAPNDREEYANHAYFLDQVRSYQEFFSQFFTNTGKHWVIKPHAVRAFYNHLAGYSVFIRNPHLYGFGDNLKELKDPKFNIIDVALTAWQEQSIRKLTGSKKRVFGELVLHPNGMNQRNKFSQVSKGFMLQDGKIIDRGDTNKTSCIIDIVKKHDREQVIIWTVYDEEGNMLFDAINELGNKKVVHIMGKTKEHVRADYLDRFRKGEIDVLITKPRILGFGLNLQFCSVMIFSGMDDSYEKTYQAIKRAHRYGAKKRLQIYIPLTAYEKPMYDNVLRKKEMFEEDAKQQEAMYIDSLANELKEFVDKPIRTTMKDSIEMNKPVKTDDYTLYNGDSVKVLKKLEKDSVDLAIFSPPFASLFTYSNSVSDMGNSGDKDDEFNLHFEFFAKELFRVMKPGRNVAMHLSQLVAFKSIDGRMGLKDFRGRIISLMSECAFNYYGECVIAKNPQAQAIRTKSHALMFVQLEKDSLMSRPALNDMILIFKKPGLPDVPVKPECTRDEWIQWASGIWSDIKETDVLDVRLARSPEDVKHVCPLQLEVIERCIRLWSNRGETILDPFSGIGSTGYQAIDFGRRYVGIELKKEYFNVSLKYLNSVVNSKNKVKRARVKKSVRHLDVVSKGFE